jgi:hypothetical protein
VIEALQSLRGIAKIGAVSIMAEVGELSRFESARQLMGYSGAVSRKHSSGERIRRGSISKTGNAHLRRIVIEVAWAYRHRPGLGAALLSRQREQGEDIKAIAWKAQHRLHSRYAKLLAKRKPKQQVITAVGRDLLGFIWAVGVAAESSQTTAPQRALPIRYRSARSNAFSKRDRVVCYRHLFKGLCWDAKRL